MWQKHHEPRISKFPWLVMYWNQMVFRNLSKNGVKMISFSFFIFSGIFSPLAAPTPCCTREDTGKSKVMSVGLRVISKLTMQNEWMAIVHRQSKPTTISGAPMQQNLLSGNHSDFFQTFIYRSRLPKIWNICVFSVKINISTTGGFKVGFFQPDTDHP